MSRPPSNIEPRVIPAHVEFLAIYNPKLGTSDETLRDQLAYYYGQRGRRRQDTNAKAKNPGGEEDDEENDRLRQIGLAQGMVSFANNFSTDANVESIETEKSRIILYELERDWWVLASINLTRLPTSKTSENAYEYSAREVAPTQLLITQIIQANSLFLLHHATKLQELFDRAGRDVFCSLLERYWNKFLKEWDVLLHGNPAAEVYNATKLSGGGELGIGVGEEEWGSGEREVLEGFIERTTSLKDLIVGRYGVSPDTDRATDLADPNVDPDMWLGSGNDPAAADGISFSGMGLVSKQSLCTISKWMEAIFKHGNDAYGIGENPSSRPRAKRRKQKADRSVSAETARSPSIQEPHPKAKSVKKRAPDLRKRAMENNAAPPGIPAPIVGQAERSLDQALSKAAKKASNQESETRETRNRSANSNMTEQESSTFGTENMMKYLTLGYGTSWTLNPKGLKSEAAQAQQGSQKSPSDGGRIASNPSEDQGLQEMEPTPEVSEEEKPFKQKLEQSIGKFLIGLSGDLENAELEIDTESDPDNATSRPNEHRLFLRTLTVETRQPVNTKRNTTIRTDSGGSARSINTIGSTMDKPPTSAEASIDGAQPNITHEKVQVAIYVHQPFMFVFLFELHSLNLTIPSFYRNIHSQLGPLQKPLLRSTDPTRVAERIANAMGAKSNVTSLESPSQATNPIYDLVYDPMKQSIRTSIPNIPLPGSLAAEGLTLSGSSALSVSGSWYTLGIPIGSPSLDTVTDKNSDKLIKSAWSRIEALNAHTQILNTYLATRNGFEHEHTAKTSRGWWVLWMKVSPSFSKPGTRDGNKNNSDERRVSNAESYLDATRSQQREAFLVRRAADFRPVITSKSRTISTGPGKWLLREQKRDASGASSIGGNGGVASAKGVSDGVGVDAKKWVEGLLTLTQ